MVFFIEESGGRKGTAGARVGGKESRFCGGNSRVGEDVGFMDFWVFEIYAGDSESFWLLRMRV